MKNAMCPRESGLFRLPAIWLALALLGAAACQFGPDYPEGLVCSERDTCPPGQLCDDGICRRDPLSRDSSAGSLADAAPEADADVGPEDAGPEESDAACEQATFYLDSDQDGFGDPAEPVAACSPPPDHVADATDCDDGDASRHPGAVEVCNDVDDDCDETADDGLCRTGCADGQREGFLDQDRDPRIAACAGGFALPGLLASTAPACGRAGGDDGAVPGGAGCTAADLCADGWHVCRSAGEVAASAQDGGCSAATPGKSALFFATLQSGPGSGQCGDGANDLFGCGTTGAVPAASCAPLNAFSGDVCTSLPAPWSCGTDGFNEAANAVKPGPELGGVLCCRDPIAVPTAGAR